MGERVELKFKVEDERALNEIIEDLKNYYKISEINSCHYEDIYFLGDADGEKEYRMRRNVEKNTYHATKKVGGATKVDETYGLMVRHEQEADISLDQVSDANDQFLRINKFRRSITLDGEIIIGFDVVDGLGTFLEIEGSSCNVDKLLRVAAQLERY